MNPDSSRPRGYGPDGPEMGDPVRSRTPSSAQPPPRIGVNIVLFLLTVVTTISVGARYSENPDAFSSVATIIVSGLPYSAALLGILLAHEMGHYLTSRYYGVSASLPYFIPLPPPFLAGTLGAIIRMRAVIRDRRILFDIGIAGPLAGVLIALPVTLVGLYDSQVIQVGASGGGLDLGDSLLFMLLIKWVFGSLQENQTVLLHPVAFAGWLGFFLTSINLLPMGQLDGGHVTYGIFGPRHRFVSRGMFLALVFWGVHGAFRGMDPFAWLWGLSFAGVVINAGLWPNPSPVMRYAAALLALIGILGNLGTLWVVFAVIMCFVRLDHPPTRDISIPLDFKRKVLGWIALVLFVLTFIPEPIRLVTP